MIHSLYHSVNLIVGLNRLLHSCIRKSIILCVHVQNYFDSVEGWLSVTPGWHAIKYKESGKAQEHPRSLQLQNILVFVVYDWKTAVEEPVSSCSSTTEHKVFLEFT